VSNPGETPVWIFERDASHQAMNFVAEFEEMFC
jgi:hypothetical protein